MKRLAPLWIPGVILLLAVWFKPQALESLAKLGVKPQLLVYTVGVAGLFLSWRFNRSRILLALLSLIAGYVFLQLFMVKGRVVDATAAAMIVGGLLCLNYFSIAFIPERGVMSRYGRAFLLAVVVEVTIVLLLMSIPKLAQQVDQIRYYGTLRALPGSSLSLVTVSLAAATAALLLFRTVYYRSSIDAGLLISLLAALTGLHYIGMVNAEALYFATAALVMQTTIVQDSHTRVYLDEQTGLHGRRALDEQLMCLGRQYAIAMIDIDRFKQFNDRFGHDAGDQALRFIAAHLARTRGGAMVFRYGGEEFTLLFRGKSVDEALPFIEQTRERIEKSPFVIRGIDRPDSKPAEIRGKTDKTLEYLSISVGVAGRDDKRRDSQEVIKLADQKLYQAKHDGRNCVRY